ncbi:MFS general substrate transporter [Morchella conica CCBAS932]|uniref:MFS general substrate transporter n=1 Tax=Morchella conica CCBAS932 TaxID=1392247 RepID=A0A3N4L0Y2_9PEZI|nr:MFS general substrate transporter [Morchella conica CCBAS932]
MLEPSDVSLDIERAERQASRQLHSPSNTDSPVEPDYPSSSSSDTHTNNDDDLSRQYTHRDIIPGPRNEDSNRIQLERQRTHLSIYSNTVGRTVNDYAAKDGLPPFGGGKEYPPQLPHREQYVVEFEGSDDPMHGQNWPLKKKMITAAVLGYTTLVSAWGSSVFSSATEAVAIYFGISAEVAILGLSFYVLGFASGPLIWAPMSELKGRRLPLILGIFGFSIFQIAVAVAKDAQTVLICRFWGGFFASCPLAVVGAVFADIFTQETRGSAIAVFSMAVFSGPLIAPIAGGFITESYLGWRWTEYTTAIMGFVALFLNIFFLEETYPPVILVAKASELRRLTRNWGIHAKQEEIEVNFKELISKNFGRPLKLLFSEPIIFLLSLYTAFIYGILYIFLTAYPIVFREIRGYTLGVAALPYLGMVIGMILGGLMVIAFQPWTNKRMRANNNVPIPEDRLVPAIIGSIVFPIGLFWFSWSGNYPEVHWVVPTLAGIPIGIGLITIFLQSLNYLIDAYLMFAASAIAANTFLRSAFAAGFPLFGRQMFHNLGVNWAGSLLGFIAIAMIPIPISFFLFGARIRARSKWAPTTEVNGK